MKFHHRALACLGLLYERFKAKLPLEDWLRKMAANVPVIFLGRMDAASICASGLVESGSMQKGSVKINWLDRVRFVQNACLTPEQFEKKVRELAPEMADQIGDWYLCGICSVCG